MNRALDDGGGASWALVEPILRRVSMRSVIYSMNVSLDG